MKHYKFLLAACIAGAIAAPGCGRSPQNRIEHSEPVPSARFTHADLGESVETQLSALSKALELATRQQSALRENQDAIAAKVAKLTELLEDAFWRIDHVNQEVQLPLDTNALQGLEPPFTSDEQEFSQISEFDREFSASLNTSSDVRIEDQLLDVASTAATHNDALVTAEYRSGLCRIEVGHENEDMAEEFAEKFVLESPFDSDGLIDVTEGVDGKTWTVVYRSNISWAE